jgi:hypothetical protein
MAVHMISGRAFGQQRRGGHRKRMQSGDKQFVAGPVRGIEAPEATSKQQKRMQESEFKKIQISSRESKSQRSRESVCLTHSIGSCACCCWGTEADCGISRSDIEVAVRALQKRGCVVAHVDGRRWGDAAAHLTGQKDTDISATIQARRALAAAGTLPPAGSPAALVRVVPRQLLQRLPSS